MHPSPLEITWTAIAVVAIAFTFWLIRDCWYDLAAVQMAIRMKRERERSRRWWYAIRDLVSNSVLLFIWGGFAAIGFVALLLPPPPPTSERAIASEVTGWVLVFMESLLAAVQVWGKLVRTKIRIRIPPVRPTEVPHAS